MIPRILYNEAVLDPAAAAGGGMGGAAVAVPATPAAPTATSSAAAESPAAPAWLGSDGALADGWHTHLGDQYAPFADTAKNFKNIGDLVKSVVTLRGAGPAYPGEQSTPEQVQRFREAAQVPADAKGYGLAAPEKLPEGVTWDQTTADKIAAVAHKHHVPAPAMQALVAAQLEVEAGRAQAYKDWQAGEIKKAQDSLVEAWRGDFEANASTVRHFTSRIAESAGVSPEEAIRLANDPAFAKMAFAMSKLTSESGTRTPLDTSLRSPRQRADDIMKGKDTEWSEKYRNGDRQAMTVVANLLKEAER